MGLSSFRGTLQGDIGVVSEGGNMMAWLIALTAYELAAVAALVYMVRRRDRDGIYMMFFAIYCGPISTFIIPNSPLYAAVSPRVGNAIVYGSLLLILVTMGHMIISRILARCRRSAPP